MEACGCGDRHSHGPRSPIDPTSRKGPRFADSPVEGAGFEPSVPLEVLTVGIDPCGLRGPFHVSLPKTKFAADSALEREDSNFRFRARITTVLKPLYSVSPKLFAPCRRTRLCEGPRVRFPSPPAGLGERCSYDYQELSSKIGRAGGQRFESLLLHRSPSLQVDFVAAGGKGHFRKGERS